MAALAPRRGPERLLDLMFARGPVRRTPSAPTPAGLSLAALEAKPHGIDFGPLAPRIPEGPAHAIGQDRARARAAWSPTSRACARRSSDPGAPWS